MPSIIARVRLIADASSTTLAQLRYFCSASASGHRHRRRARRDVAAHMGAVPSASRT
jgi:hypothetical protein